MGKTTSLTDKQRDSVIELLDHGIKPSKIAEVLGISITAVRTIHGLVKLIREDRLDEIRDYVKSHNATAPLKWALNKYAVVLPEEKKEEPKIVEEKGNIGGFILPAPSFNIKDGIKEQLKEVVGEAISENCKCNIEQIDKDQMARIMLALGKIAGSLETIIDKLDDLAGAWK